MASHGEGPREIVIGMQWTADIVYELMKANHQRYEQRFAAHEESMKAALTARDQWITVALAAHEKLEAAALAAQDKAVLAAALRRSRQSSGPSTATSRISHAMANVSPQ
ncbi:hypothetical protein AB0J90_03260 [Micromonospora sp. NPDC049523]|uniref:hypothetical protein n=1 Tax=Micromonospora sp. NPDC049523 TaxID=3155921 RepID=UPI003425C263